MKCHYEVLEISKDSEDSQIKTAYRKLALKWHPDKNLDNPDVAKEQFQMVQQAYEVLSDKQERAWYDAHRDQILKGAGSDFEDKSLDVFPYFTTTCFKGFGDDDSGFYSVYRKVFEQIAKEDIVFIDEKEEFCEIPGFGSSTSDYEDVVKVFYDFWSGYLTKKSYTWLDPYDIREGRGNRRLLKEIEKENKKLRQKAKKERNEEVRNLVAFVRKRDKRVQTYKKEMELRTLENRKKQEILSKQRRLENTKQQVNETQADWLKFDNVKSELEEIEKHLAKEFGDVVSNSEEEEDFNNLYCIACNKVFKNPKAFENHEFSKKHRENIAKLKQNMLEEEEMDRESNLEEYDELEVDDEDIDEIIEENGCISEEESIGTEEDVKEISRNSKKKKRKGKHMQTINGSEVIRDLDSYMEEDIQGNRNGISRNGLDVDDESSEDSDVVKKNKKSKNVRETEVDKNIIEDINISKVSDDDFDFGLSKNQKKKANKRTNSSKTKQNPSKSDDTQIVETNGSVAQEIPSKFDISSGPSKKPSKKEKKSKQKEISTTDLSEIDMNHCCVTCKSYFSSKNKLFDHLKKTGHGVYIPSKVRQAGGKKGSVKS